MFLDDLVQYIEDNTTLGADQLYTSFIIPTDRTLIAGVGFVAGGTTSYNVGNNVIGNKQLQLIVNIRGTSNDLTTREMLFEIFLLLDGLRNITLNGTNIILCQANQPQLIGIDDNKNYEYSFTASLDVEN